MKYFDLAKKMSKKSDHRQHKIGGVIVNKSKIVSVGFNKCKTHTKSNQPYKSIHCELDLVLGVDENLLKGASVYLYRETRQGTVALSRPCKFCWEILRQSQIKLIFYTDYGSFKQELI